MIDVNKVNSFGGDAFNAALREELLKELLACRGRWMELARQSGGEVSYSWLIAFTSGKFAHSTNKNMLKVAKYLGVESTPDGLLFETGKHFIPPAPVWSNNQESV